MVTTRVSLKNDNVNSGNEVYLNLTGFTFGWKNFVNITPIEGLNDLSDADFGGIENPIIPLRGIMNIDNLGNNELTQQLLTDFALIRTGSLALSISAGSSTTNFGSRPDVGYAVGSALGSTLGVVINSFNFDINNASDNGHIWRYSIEFKEV